MGTERRFLLAFALPLTPKAKAWLTFLHDSEFLPVVFSSHNKGALVCFRSTNRLIMTTDDLVEHLRLFVSNGVDLSIDDRQSMDSCLSVVRLQ